MSPSSDQARRQLVRAQAQTPEGVWITCAGRSMEPTIKLGDRVRIVACERVRAGDIVLFEIDGAHVLHRVVCPIPGASWFLHIGDAGSGDGPGLARAARVVGRAELPRALPPAAVYAAAAARLARALRRMITG